MGIFEPNGSNSTRLKSACQEDIVPFGKKTESVVQDVENSHWARPLSQEGLGRRQADAARPACDTATLLAIDSYAKRPSS